MNRKKVAVIDIDGVIADARHRLHLIKGKKKNWDLFYALVDIDPPLQTGRDLVNSLAQNYDIVYLTGRRESTRSDTVAWLDRHDFPAGEGLWMRPDGDYRSAATLKLEHLGEMVTVYDAYDVALVVDDDPKVCDALNKAGIMVIQATWARAAGA